MVSSFLSCRVDRTLLLSHFFPPLLLLLHLCLHMRHILLFLLYHLLPPLLFNSMPLCNFHTTCYITAPCSGTLAPDSLPFSFPCNHILCTPWTSQPLWVSSTLPCTLPLPLGVAPSLYYAFSPFPILFVVMPFLPFCFFHFSWDIPTSCVLLFYIQNTSPLLSPLSVFLLLLRRIALPYLPGPQIYLLISSSFLSPFLLCSYSF